MLETLDYTIRIGSIPTFLYFDLYLYSAYAAHFVYSQKGIRASQDALQRKVDGLWTPKILGGKEIILNDLPKIYKYIWKEIALIFNIMIHLTFWQIWRCP